MKIKIGKKYVGDGCPTYVIAEIGSNFDGSFERAKYLIDLAKKAGCDAAKFQSFKADKIVSKSAFSMKTSFQAKWDKPVYDVYQGAEFPRKWHKDLRDYCHKSKIEFFSSPYDIEAVELLEELDIPAYKIGSGDVNHLELLEYIAKKGRPMIIGTGASTIGEVETAVETVRATGNEDLILLQCITNYPSPFEDAHIRAMVTLRQAFETLVGYSDHTPGSVVPLGAVALGACLIEKHFTCDKTRKGPDHPFAMDYEDMSSMVRDIRNLEKALGTGKKRVEPSERETVVLQRRGLVAARDLAKGAKLTTANVTSLRPHKGLKPTEKGYVLGRKLKKGLKKGDPIAMESLV